MIVRLVGSLAKDISTWWNRPPRRHLEYELDLERASTRILAKRVAELQEANARLISDKEECWDFYESRKREFEHMQDSCESYKSEFVLWRDKTLTMMPELKKAQTQLKKARKEKREWQKKYIALFKERKK